MCVYVFILDITFLSWSSWSSWRWASPSSLPSSVHIGSYSWSHRSLAVPSWPISLASDENAISTSSTTWDVGSTVLQLGPPCVHWWVLRLTTEAIRLQLICSGLDGWFCSVIFHLLFWENYIIAYLLLRIKMIMNMLRLDVVICVLDAGILTDVRWLMHVIWSYF